MKDFKKEDALRKELGRRGEEIAARVLQRRGMSVLDRNYHSRHKEIDLICTEPSGSRPGCVNLRFVEVKTRREPVCGEPWEAVNLKKQQNLAKGARGFLSSGRMQETGLRYDEIFFDIVTVVWNEEGTGYRTEYFPDAFRIFDM